MAVVLSQTSRTIVFCAAANDVSSFRVRPELTNCWTGLSLKRCRKRPLRGRPFSLGKRSSPAHCCCSSINFGISLPGSASVTSNPLEAGSYDCTANRSGRFGRDNFICSSSHFRQGNESPLNSDAAASETSRAFAVCTNSRQQLPFRQTKCR
jgi:hypothetical protein